MTSTEKYLQETVRKAFDEWRVKFEDRFNINLDDITISFDLKGFTFGRACLSDNHIQYNPDAMADNIVAFLRTTLPHEIAHMVAWRLWDDRGHGKMWKYTMEEMGLSSARCNGNYKNVQPARKPSKRNFKYTLPCGCTFDVARKKHNSFQTGKRMYKKRNWKTAIEIPAQFSCRKHRTVIKPEHFVSGS